jgi:hypothetical protein
MNYYKRVDGKYDLSTFSDEYFNRIRFLAELAEKYEFILKVDVLDNCSFFRDNFDKHPFNNNHQNIKIAVDDIYKLSNTIKPYIYLLYKKHWEILSPYKKYIKLGFMNEADYNKGGKLDYTKYKPLAEFHKLYAEQIFDKLNIPRKAWRINPQTNERDYILQANGDSGENGWTYSMGFLDAEAGKCKNVEGEIHGVGSQKTKGILPELFLRTVFNPAFDEISFSDDGVSDGQGEAENNEGKWASETVEEFVELFEKILKKAIEKNKEKISVEHLTRSPEKNIDKIKGDMTKRELDEFVTDETLAYYREASKKLKELTSINTRRNIKFIEKTECQSGDKVFHICEDGNSIVEKECVNGKWVETNESCKELDCACRYYLSGSIFKWDFRRFFKCLLGIEDEKCK